MCAQYGQLVSRVLSQCDLRCSLSSFVCGDWGVGSGEMGRGQKRCCWMLARPIQGVL